MGNQKGGRMETLAEALGKLGQLQCYGKQEIPALCQVDLALTVTSQVRYSI